MRISYSTDGGFKSACQQCSAVKAVVLLVGLVNAIGQISAQQVYVFGAQRHGGALGECVDPSRVDVTKGILYRPNLVEISGCQDYAVYVSADVDKKISDLRMEVLTNVGKVPDVLKESIRQDVVQDLKSDPAFVAQIRAAMEQPGPPRKEPDARRAGLSLGLAAVLGASCLLAGVAIGRFIK